jgi:hypothetical protein
MGRNNAEPTNGNRIACDESNERDREDERE